MSQLPAKYRDAFLAEYYPAAEAAAKNFGRYATLRDLLRLWRLRAAMYSEPGYEAAQVIFEASAFAWR